MSFVTKVIRKVIMARSSHPWIRMTPQWAGLVRSLNKLDIRPEARNFIKKETLSRVFSYKFCKTFKNTSYYRTPEAAASEHIYLCMFVLHHFALVLLDKWLIPFTPAHCTHLCSTVDARYLEHLLSRTFTISNFLAGPLNFSSNTRLKSIRYLKLRYLELSLSRTNHLVP